MATIRTTSTLATSLLRRHVGEDDTDNDETSVGLAKLEAFVVLNRSHISEWVEHQKALVDAHAETHRQAALVEQNQLDRLHQNLLALQLDRSLCLADNDDEEEDDEKKGTEGAEGTTTTTHQQRLVKEQRQVEADLERVQALARDKQSEIEGS
jgi:ParB-like chromosome segregation protein Spo0J